MYVFTYVESFRRSDLASTSVRSVEFVICFGGMYGSLSGGSSQVQGRKRGGKSNLPELKRKGAVHSVIDMNFDTQ